MDGARGLNMLCPGKAPLASESASSLGAKPILCPRCLVSVAIGLLLAEALVEELDEVPRLEGFCAFD